jgi:hypothetical protein
MVVAAVVAYPPHPLVLVPLVVKMGVVFQAVQEVVVPCLLKMEAGEGERRVQELGRQRG